MRALKSIALYVGFLVMGYTIALEPPRGVAIAFDSMQVDRVIVGVAFCISALMNGITGILGWHWNALWIAIFLFYTGVNGVAVILSIPPVSVTATASYAILSVYLIADMLSEETWNWRSLLKR